MHEHACQVWARSPQASKLDAELNDAFRSITGCLRPTNVEELYLFAGVAPTNIRRDVCARVENRKQERNAAHSLHGQIPAERRLKRACVLSSVRPADFPSKVIRCSEWQRRCVLKTRTLRMYPTRTIAQIAHPTTCDIGSTYRIWVHGSMARVRVYIT